jgi:hypothetical protein
MVSYAKSNALKVQIMRKKKETEWDNNERRCGLKIGKQWWQW